MTEVNLEEGIVTYLWPSVEDPELGAGGMVFPAGGASGGRGGGGGSNGTTEKSCAKNSDGMPVISNETLEEVEARLGKGTIKVGGLYKLNPV